MNKKLTTAAAAVAGALVYGGAELLELNERLTALEDAHPELIGEAEKPAEEKPEEQGDEEAEKPEVEAEEEATKTEG
jgi:hypothetical protein